MASQNSLRQASRILRSTQAHVNIARSRQYSSHSPYTAASLSRIRPTRPSHYHALQQTRNLSLWGSSKAAEQTTPIPTSNITITEPSQFENARTIKAVDTTSHNPNSLEPQVLEDAQQSLLQPHTSNDIAPPLEEIPERIGYLREVCDLDFGWGPTSTMEWIFEHMHIWGGLSWTASAIGLGLLLRSCMLPLMVMQQKETAKLKGMHQHIAPIQAKIQQANLSGDQKARYAATLELQALNREAGIKWRYMLYPFLLQLPFGFGAWRLLRNAASLPVPGFVTENWYWLTDLTFSDELYILPAVSGAMIYLTLKIQEKLNATTASTLGNRDLQGIVRKVLPAVSFVFMIFQPGAVQLYFAASSTMGMLTTTAISWNPTRKLFGIPTNVQPKPVEQTSSSSTATSTATSSSSTQEQPKQPPPFMRMRGQTIDATARTLDTAATASSTSSTPRSSKTSFPEPQQEISVIDKGVNAVKDRALKFQGSLSRAFSPVWGTRDEKIAAKRREFKRRDEIKEAALAEQARQDREAARRGR